MPYFSDSDSEYELFQFQEVTNWADDVPVSYKLPDVVKEPATTPPPDPPSCCSAPQDDSAPSSSSSSTACSAALEPTAPSGEESYTEATAPEFDQELCPCSRHALRAFRARDDGYKCGGCGNLILLGTSFYGCESCPFDVCDNCFLFVGGASCPDQALPVEQPPLLDETEFMQQSVPHHYQHDAYWMPPLPCSHTYYMYHQGAPPRSSCWPPLPPAQHTTYLGPPPVPPTRRLQAKAAYHQRKAKRSKSCAAKCTAPAPSGPAREAETTPPPPEAQAPKRTATPPPPPQPPKNDETQESKREPLDVLFAELRQMETVEDYAIVPVREGDEPPPSSSRRRRGKKKKR